MGRRVLFWGRFDHGYSKTRVNAAAFRALGWEVDYFDVKWCCRLGDVEAFFRGLDRRPRPDLVLVPVCRQRDIAAACRWAHKRGIKVLFDPMISAWDKKVLEQKKWKAEERRAKRLLAWEKKLMAMPDFITWDTSCHVDFAAEYLDVPREKMTPLFHVGHFLPCRFCRGISRRAAREDDAAFHWHGRRGFQAGGRGV